MNRRRRKLVRTDLQLKVVAITLFVASFCLLVNFQLVVASLWGLHSSLVNASNYGQFLDAVRRLVIQKFLVSLAIAVPLSATIGILYSFTFSGPIYKFKKYFSELADGAPWDESCTLRKGDQLVDLCDAFNRALGQLRDRVAASHFALQEADALLRDPAIEERLDPSERDRLARVREAIAEEAEVFASRMPGRRQRPARPEPSREAEPQAAASA